MLLFACLSSLAGFDVLPFCSGCSSRWVDGTSLIRCVGSASSFLFNLRPSTQSLGRNASTMTKRSTGGSSCDNNNRHPACTALRVAVLVCGLWLLPRVSPFGIFPTRSNFREPAMMPTTTNRQTVVWETLAKTITQEDIMIRKTTPVVSTGTGTPFATEIVVETTPIPETLPEALFTFWCGHEAGPRLALGLVSGLVAWRTLLDVPLSGGELCLSGAAVVFWSVQEHFLHNHVLHSSMDWMGKSIHEGHHENPYYHISIDPAPLMCSWLLIVVFALYTFLPPPLALSTTVAYSAAGLWYEWCHFIVHTRVRFRRDSYFYHLQQHHIKHHLVDANFWLAFSIRHVDSLFGTNPNVKSPSLGRSFTKSSMGKPVCVQQQKTSVGEGTNGHNEDKQLIAKR